MASRKQKIRELFQAIISDADERISKSIENKSPHYERFELWKTMSLNAIEQVFGQGHQNFNEFSSIRFSQNSWGCPLGRYGITKLGCERRR